MVRAHPLQGWGRRFESCSAHQCIFRSTAFFPKQSFPVSCLPQPLQPASLPPQHPSPKPILPTRLPLRQFFLQTRLKHLQAPHLLPMHLPFCGLAIRSWTTPPNPCWMNTAIYIPLNTWKVISRPIVPS